MIPFHRFADLFPLLEGAEFDALVEDVRAHGVRDPIMLHEGAVLDGRNRYRALGELAKTGELRGDGWGVYAGEPVTEEDLAGDTAVPWFERYSPMMNGDPLGYVISKNLKRRHLNDDQRRMVAGRLASLGRGRPSENAADCGISRADAAKLLAIDEAGVERAKTVISKAAPEITAAVERGKLTVASAAQAAKLDAEQQRKIAEAAEAGQANVVRTIIKQESRDQRETALAEKQHALPTKQYGVILADPEWRFAPYSRTTGMDRAADNHYPTSATDEICARDVPSIAAPDCVLFLWATAPMLPDALRVMAAWGFAYRSHIIWRKDRVGTGYWFRNMHELLLVGTKGNIPAPAPGTQARSIFDAPVAEHSRKPDATYELIEAYFPHLPKIELNARTRRPGWDAWGNEAPAEESNHRTDSIHRTDSVPPHPQPQPEKDAGENHCGTPQPREDESSHDMSPGAADDLDIPAFLDRRKWAGAGA